MKNLLTIVIAMSVILSPAFAKSKHILAQQTESIVDSCLTLPKDRDLCIGLIQNGKLNVNEFYAWCSSNMDLIINPHDDSKAIALINPAADLTLHPECNVKKN